MPIDLKDYVDVAARIVEFRAKHPEGSLQPANPKEPFTIMTVGESLFIVYVAACYRTPDDRRPGIGVAWEPFPGKTPYTKDSELQNAETSAWGRAIVAALAADTKAGVASQEEVRNRRNDTTSQTQRADAKGPPLGPEEQPTSKGNTRRGPRVLDGWADIDEQRAGHDEYSELLATAPLTDEQRIEHKAWKDKHHPGWPLAKADLAVVSEHVTEYTDAPF